MHDFGAILRKAREGAVSRGAAGAAGATLEKLCEISAPVVRLDGPSVELELGPVGPLEYAGPTGPKAFCAVGPAFWSSSGEENQRFSNGGPSGPSEKQHVRENRVLRPIHSALPRDLLPDTPQGWRDGLARLDRWTPPCEGFRSGEWEAVHRSVSHFMDQYAAEAAAHGWTAIDLFGIHRAAGAADVSSCGALMLPLLRNATALTAGAITFGPLTYRRRAMPEAVLIWNFTGETQ